MSAMEPLENGAVQVRVVREVLHRYCSSTGALRVRDVEGTEWVIKPLRQSSIKKDRVLNYNEQVVGRLGNALLPDVIPEVALACISQEIKDKYSLSDVVPSVCHASRFVKGFGDGESIRKPNEVATEARLRIARLAALLRVCATEGRQFFYKEPNCCDALVYSVDHGSSFLDPEKADIRKGEEGQWLGECFADNVSLSICFELVTTAGLERDEIARGVCVLKTLTDEVIVEAVHAPPEPAFEIPMERRKQLAEWLQTRRNTLLASACQRGGAGFLDTKSAPVM